MGEYSIIEMEMESCCIVGKWNDSVVVLKNKKSADELYPVVATAVVKIPGIMKMYPVL